MEKLTVYLGSKCNLNCAYCHRETAEKEEDISGQFLEHIRGRKDIRIKFMGGEPTLYMKEIQKVVEAAPDAQYAIATNGVNLKKHLDFFKKYKFLVCVSYDGCDDNLRGYDPFTDLLQYPWLAVSCTLYHGNTDFKKIMSRFAEKERIIGRWLSFFPHIVHYTGEHNKKFALDQHDYEHISAQYKECLGKFISDYINFGIVNIRYKGLFCQLQRRYHANYKFGETYCVNKGIKKCDAAGKLFSCLYIRNEELTENGWQDEQAAAIQERYPRCRHCDVYDMCGAACIKSIGHEMECTFYNELYSWFRQEYKKHEKELDRLKE